MSIITSVLAVALLVLSFTRAAAYQVGDVDIKVDAGVSQTYDDNVTYVKDNKKDDFVTGLSVGVSAEHEGKSHTASLRLGFLHSFYARNRGFGNTQETLDGKGNFELSKYERLTLSEEFTHAEDPTSFEDEFGRVSGRYAYFLNRLAAGYSRDVSKQLTLNAGFINELYFPSRSGSSDSYGNSLRFSADYAVRSTTIISGVYQIAHRVFNPGKSALTNTFGGGARQYLTSQLYLDGFAGIDLIRAYNGNFYARPAFVLTATDEIDENTRAYLSFTRRYDLNAYTADTFENWRVSAGATRQLLSRLSGDLNAFIGQGEYDQSRVKNTTGGVGAGLRYELRENASLDARYSFSRVSSNDETNEYARNQFTVGIRVVF